MKPYRSVSVGLLKTDQKQITELLSKGTHSARVLRRALTLQQLDQGLAASQVAANLQLAPKTVRAIAYRYQDEGLKQALYERPRPGAVRRIQPSQQQRIIAMVCSDPPAGQARWSVRLIVQEAMRRKLIPTIGRESVRVLLQNHDLQPWGEKNVVRGRTGPAVHRKNGRSAGAL
jgi:putative transposase